MWGCRRIVADATLLGCNAVLWVVCSWCCSASCPHLALLDPDCKVIMICWKIDNYMCSDSITSRKNWIINILHLYCVLCALKIEAPCSSNSWYCNHLPTYGCHNPEVHSVYVHCLFPFISFFHMWMSSLIYTFLIYANFIRSSTRV